MPWTEDNGGVLDPGALDIRRIKRGAPATASPMSSPSRKCRCHLSLEPPTGIEWWLPDVDPDPGPKVRAVVRWGDEPELRRAVRLANGAGWEELGAMVNFYREITPPLPWEHVGRCWAENHHPVVAVRAEPDGKWVFR